jgi:hypothetical protein
MKHASQLRGDTDALTVHIDKNARDELFYALRVGDRAPEKDETNLISLGDVLARLDQRLNAVLTAGGRPPEVRIACHKDLPSERVHELAKELQRRKDADKIAFYGAEVNEKK